MKTVLTSALILTSAAALSAQNAPTTLTIAESAGYAVVATSGSTTEADFIADSTVVTSELIGARTDNARALTRLFNSTGSRRSTNTVSIYEIGSVWNSRGQSNAGDAGTAAGDDTNATQASHTVSVHFDVEEDKTAAVTVFFSGSASGDSEASVSVDIDGDMMSDWDAKTDTSSRRGVQDSETFNIKAGKNGITITITTEGDAALGSTGDLAGYNAQVSARARVIPTPLTCTATAFGNECAGKLEAKDLSSRTQRILELALTNAPADAVGFLVFGMTKINVPLPGSMCELLVDPVGMSTFRTNSNGESRQFIRTSLTTSGAVLVQDVTVSLGSGGVKLESSNGLEIECK